MTDPSAPGSRNAGGGSGWLVDLGAWAVVLALILAVSAGIAWIADRVMIAYEAAQAEPMIVVPAPPPPATIDDQGRAIRNPAWAVRPGGVYPPSAAAAGVTEGLATLNCRVGVDGTLDDCRTVREEPAGVGFAAAAEEGVAQARLHPRMVDGEPQASRITFTTRYRLE